jgi:ATP-binding cassette subfamily B protein
MVARFYGKSYSLQYLRSLSHITREGVSMLGISDAAEAIGFRTQGVKLTWEQLRDEVPFPCIVHWRQNHFVVVYDIKKCGREGEEQVYVADPAHDLVVYNKKEFLKCWYSSKENEESIGTALLLEPTPEFYRDSDDEEKKFKISRMFGYLTPYKRFLAQIFLALLVGSLISMIFPFITQSVVDFGINNSNLNFIILALVAQMVLTFGQTANELIRSWLMLHVTTRMSINIVSDFLTKLMKLPIAFFDAKMVGDIMQRISDNGRIQTFLTGSVLNILFSVITFVIYAVIMAIYHPTILVIFLIGSGLYALWVTVFLKYRRTLDYKRFQQSADNQSSLVQLVNGMQEIKLNNCEKQKRWEWERVQAKLYKISIKSLALGQTQQVGGMFIDQTKNIFISFLAAKAVIDGDMTLGMMTAMQYILGQLNAPISQFIGFIQQAQDAKISAERLGEIHDMKNEEPDEDELIRDIPEHADIRIQNVVFQYEGPHSEKVLDGVTLDIPANKVTAIVGMSGSGKSTLLKLLLGFYAPVSGKITLDDKPMDAYSPSRWRRDCGVVMQEGYIFSDTIAGNIGVIDEIPRQDKVIEAAATANIHDFIGGLPLRYNTKIGGDGHGLSTGQKQRLLISRAVYKNPKYIFLDEATNALDANNERTIMDNLRRFFTGRTVVVVAHRLSTVMNADNIVVLDHGRITEQGRHEELVARRGAYYNLVKDQLALGE